MVNNQPLHTADAAVSSPTATVDPRHLYSPGIAASITRSIKEKALSANALASYCQRADIHHSREAILLRLGQYRKEYAMIETVDPGLYRLTEKGRKYLEENYPENTKTVTPTPFDSFPPQWDNQDGEDII